jgi:hypothetical protein
MAVPWTLAMLPVQRKRHVRLLSNKTPLCLLPAHSSRRRSSGPKWVRLLRSTGREYARRPYMTRC